MRVVASLVVLVPLVIYVALRAMKQHARSVAHEKDETQGAGAQCRELEWEHQPTLFSVRDASTARHSLG